MAPSLGSSARGLPMRAALCAAVAALLALRVSCGAVGYAAGTAGGQLGSTAAMVRLDMDLHIIDFTSHHGGKTLATRKMLQDDVGSFFDAAADGDVSEVMRLLESVGDVDVTDEFNDTALIIAAANDEVAVMRVLLTAGADINKQGQMGSTALYAAVQNDQVNAIKFLIEEEADLEIKSTGATPLILASNLGQLAVVHFLLDAGADITAEYDVNQATPLIAAADAGHSEVVKVLLEAGADTEFRTNFGYTALHRAGLNNSYPTVKTLLEGGADVNALVWGNGDTVLIAAAEFADLPLITGLVDAGVDVTAKNKFGRTALHTAALKANNRDVLALMIEKGVNIDEKTTAGVTALNDATWMGNKDNVQYLLDQGADTSTTLEITVCGCNYTEPMSNIWPNCPAGQCATAEAVAEIKALLGLSTEPEDLLKAVKDSDAGAVAAFIADGADVNAATEDGLTPIIAGAIRGNVAILKALLDAGADASARDSVGGSPLSYAAYFGRTAAIKAFLEAGVDVNGVDVDGFSALHIGAEQGQLVAVKALLEAGADAGLLSDPLMISPVFAAASAQPPTILHASVLQVIIDAGADPSVLTVSGVSTLHAAAANLGGKVLMTKLINAGVDVNVTTPTGVTPLQVAAYYGYDVGVKFLLAMGADPAAGSSELNKVCGCADEAGDESLRGCPLGTCQTPEQTQEIVDLLGDAYAAEKPAPGTDTPSVIRTANPCKASTTFLSALAVRIECQALGEV